MTPPPSLSTMLDGIGNAVRSAGGELRAGGTDVSARHRGGIATGPFVDLLVDLRGIPEVQGISPRGAGGTRIGALTTVARIADDRDLREKYPALAFTAGALATPQIRAAGTLGGNLLQRNRCWYYRNPEFSCFQTGGDSCPAHTGLNPYGTVIDQGPCVAPHASSIAMALIGYDAVAEVHGRGRVAVRDLYDGSDPTRDHVLRPGEVLTAVDLPAPLIGERAAYHRAISRFAAEWPLVEAVARVTMDGPVITFASVAVGGVARTPLRLPDVEQALVGREVTVETLVAAASTTLDRCAAPGERAQTGYKVTLLRDTVLQVLEQAVHTGR